CHFVVTSPPRSTRLPYTTLFRSREFFVALPDQTGFSIEGENLTAWNSQTISVYQLAQDGTLSSSIDNSAGFAGNVLDASRDGDRSEEHTSELQSRENLVCRLLLE